MLTMQVVTQGLCGSGLCPDALLPSLATQPTLHPAPQPQIPGLFFLLSFLKILFLCNSHTPTFTDVYNVSGFLQSFFSLLVCLVPLTSDLY